ncbi:sodium/hydrogen exchanger 6, partial [Tanacetum coccineum]
MNDNLSFKNVSFELFSMIMTIGIRATVIENKVKTLTIATFLIKVHRVKHYNQFLGAEGVSNPLDAHDLFIHVLDNSKADCTVRDVTDDEIKSVMFSMGDDRALGPDGFTAAFFKKAWDVVTTPVRINDYRPISCCNVLYKCISKIIANRVKEGLGDIVSINQSAFVPGRRNSDNILLTQELMRNYPCRFWFSSKDGPMDYGDPLSPYLFTLVMEILTLLLQRK